MDNAEQHAINAWLIGTLRALQVAAPIYSSEKYVSFGDILLSVARQMQKVSNMNSAEHKYYVHITGRRGRFVEFDFAIGSPDLAMELIMPEELFKEFCERYHVITLNDQQIETIDSERAEWRYGTSDPDQLV